MCNQMFKQHRGDMEKLLVYVVVNVGVVVVVVVARDGMVL